MVEPLPTPDNAIQVVPPDAEFKGPFTNNTKSVHMLTNTSTFRLCIKLKVSDNQLIQCKPIVAFIPPGQQQPLHIQHKAFEYNQSDAEKRKLAIFYAAAPDNAADPTVFVKDNQQTAKWKSVKIPVKYAVVGSMAASSAPPAEQATTAAEASKAPA